MSSLSGLEEAIVETASQGSRLRAALHFSNLYILLVALGLITATFALMDIPAHLPVLIAGCSGAFLVYQIDRSLFAQQEDEVNQPERVAWIRTHQALVYLSLLVFLCAGCVAAFSLDKKTLLTGGLLIGFGALYLMPILPGGIRPKSIWFVKPIAIAFAWSAGTVLFPLQATGMSLNGYSGGLFLYRLLFILPNVLLTDWPDRKGDAEVGLKSLATMLSNLQLRWTAGAIAGSAVLVGFVLGRISGWPLVYFIDLVGPVLLLLICTRKLTDSHIHYGLMLDLVVSWPLVTAFLIWIS